MLKDTKGKIVQLLKESTKENTNEPLSQEIKIKGNSNVVGNGNTVIVTEKHVTKTKVEPKPGVEHITEEQVCRLHDLKDKIIELEALTKKDPATHLRVWRAFNKKMRIGSMRMLPATKFKTGEKYLQTWIGRLTGSKTAEKKAPETVKKTKLSYIRTNMRKLKCEDKVRDYMDSKFGVRSTSDLPDLDAIKQVYNYIASLKRSL